MALPAHLQRYDGLLDILVEALVSESEEIETKTEKPAAPGRALPRVEIQRNDDHNGQRHDAATLL